MTCERCGEHTRRTLVSPDSFQERICPDCYGEVIDYVSIAMYLEGADPADVWGCE